MPVWREEESQEEDVRLAICVGHEFVVEGLVSYGCVRLREAVFRIPEEACMLFENCTYCMNRFQCKSHLLSRRCM